MLKEPPSQANSNNEVMPPGKNQPKNELDVDFIGGVGPLTKNEEKRIREVIKMLKSKKRPTRRPTRKLTIKKKVTA